MLLKQYTGDRNLASAAGVDEKTFRKWSWTIIEAVSWLESEVVNIIFMFYPSFFIIHSFNLYCTHFKIRYYGTIASKET